ncbi:2-isopropylmalate synthase, partial [Candidatus Gottesmanbacteria bacterium]|nr:2-isopropylmalate synthase [Candidatus Gottesmanbacteria bacterium]
LNNLGVDLPKDKLDIFYKEFLNLADLKKEIHDDDLKVLIEINNDQTLKNKFSSI